MRRVLSLWKTTVGKKAAMAVSGLILLLYVFLHMVGNLHVYQGPDKYNEYAEFLRVVGAPAVGESTLLWIVRIVLLVAVVVHVVAAVQLARRSRAARPVRYRNTPHEEFSYASRTMRWGGVILALFVAYHLMHLTWGNAHPDFRPGDVYHNFVAGFRSWPASLAYIAAMIALGFHIYHGLWSGMQSLGLNHARYRRLRRPFAAGLALVIVLGNISFPIAVLAGLLG